MSTSPTSSIRHSDYSYAVQQQAESSGSSSSSSAATQEEFVSTKGTIFSLPATDIIQHSILIPYLDARDLAALQQTCKFFDGVVRDIFERATGYPTTRVYPIIENYGFQRLMDPRNRIIIQKAFEACVFEELGDDLNPYTLADKMKIVEDRNLVRIYLRYLNTIAAVQNMDDGCAQQPYPGMPSQIQFFSRQRLDNAPPQDKQFVITHPEFERACCLKQITNIAQTADAIRERFQNGERSRAFLLDFRNYLRRFEYKPTEKFDIIQYYANGNSENTTWPPHLDACDLYMSIIPPEIRNFHIIFFNERGNSLMLIPRNIGEALRRTDTFDVRQNQLGTIPDEARGFFSMYRDPILEQQQNDENLNQQQLDQRWNDEQRQVVSAQVPSVI